MIRLIVKAEVADKESKDFNYEFDQPVVTLGRLKENDIQLPLSTVSGYHSQILQEGDNYYLLDRGSINGTFLNRQRIPSGERKLLRDGDVIRIQSFDIYFSTGSMMKIDQGATVQVARQMVMEVLGSWEAQSKEKPRLIIMGGPQGGKQIELVEGKNVVVGRGANCDIVVDHPSISRRHAEITFTWNGAFVKDLNSSNGVYVNDVKISGSQKLHDRDELQMGQQGASDPVRIVFSNPAEALLAKIEEGQITDSNSQPAQGKEVSLAKPQAESNQATKRESTVPPALPGGSTVAAAAVAEPVVENPPAVIDRGVFVVTPKAPEPRHLPASVLFIMIVVLLGALGAGAWYYFSRNTTSVFGKLTPAKGTVGDTVTINGENLDGAGITAATIEHRNAMITSLASNEIKIKIPNFPNMDPEELHTEIDLLQSNGTAQKFPFVLMIYPQINSVDPTSAKPGTDVHIQYAGGTAPPLVFFGTIQAAVTSVDGNQINCKVPEIPNIPETGLKLPVSVRVNQIPSKSTFTFTVLAVPSLQTITPNSGGPGTEVTIATNVGIDNPSVYFGDTQATLKSTAPKEVVAIVPAPAQAIPAGGMKLPVSVRTGDTELKNKMDFTIVPLPVKPPEVFQLSFSAKPYSQNLGFNEYAVESNVGPFLVVVGKDVFGSSQARAETVAKNLNETVDFYKKNPDASIKLEPGQDNALYADASGNRKLLLHVYPEDATAYGKINGHVVAVEDLAEWWKMLIGSYFRVFVQVQNPADTGILSSGGGILQNVVNFFSVANQSGEKYYKKDFLDTMPDDQKSRLVALSFALPMRLSSVEGKWDGSMTNLLYSNISEPNLELILTLHQKDDGSVSGKADLNWKISVGGGEGQFQNVGFKKLGTYDVSGSYDKTKSYPLVFSFTDKEQGRLNFVGRIEGDKLRGSYAIGATGESGTWNAKAKQ